MAYSKHLKASMKLGQRDRFMKWRRERVILKLDAPSRPDRAKAVGYKAKQGFIVVRVRVKKGGRTRPSFHAGRKPSKRGRLKYTPKKSLRLISEEKAARKFNNMEVLNSYIAGDDGISKWFEIILVDPSHAAIKKDRTINWITKGANRGRAQRTLTAAGKVLRKSKM